MYNKNIIYIKTKAITKGCSYIVGGLTYYSLEKQLDLNKGKKKQHTSQDHKKSVLLVLQPLTLTYLLSLGWDLYAYIL